MLAQCNDIKTSIFNHVFFFYFTCSIKKLATTLGEHLFHESHNDIKLPVYTAVNGNIYHGSVPFSVAEPNL